MKILIFLAYLNLVKCLDVLILTPFGSNTVQSSFTIITKELLSKGHNVTLLSPLNENIVNNNFTHFLAPHSSLGELDMFQIRAGSNYVNLWAKAFPLIVKDMYKSPKIMNLWEKRSSFDLIILNSAANEMALPFLIDMKVPFLTFAPAGSEAIQLSYLGNIVSPAAVPFIILPYNGYMTYKQRLHNTIYTFLHRFGYHSKVGKPVEVALKEIFPKFDDLWSYYPHQSGALINRHYILDGPIPLLPNQVEVGCLSCREAKQLPKVNIFRKLLFLLLINCHK